METMISLERAREIVLEKLEPLEAEMIPLAEAYHRVLAEEITSPIAMPPFDRSPLDGYAYRAKTFDQAPLRLKVVSEIPAGSWSEREIGPGECAKIFTGAPIPPGANCVVRMEDTELYGEEVLIQHPVLPGANVVLKGEEIKEGEVLLNPGVVLTPPMVGLLAAVGVEKIKVYRRPRVGVLSTGSELVEVGTCLAPGKIYNSNTYTLKGLLLVEGCEVKAVPFVPDSLSEIIEALESLADTDVIITTGGASVGEYDLARQALEGVGCELLFWKMNMKPGTPAAAGLKGKRLYFSLSGNPAAAMITFELLVRPALRKLTGRPPQEREFTVKMAGSFPKSGKQRRFLRARAVFRDGEIWADPNFAQGSGILRSMVGSHLLVDVPGGHGPVHEGEKLQARWISSWEETK